MENIVCVVRGWVGGPVGTIHFKLFLCIFSGSRVQDCTKPKLLLLRFLVGFLSHLFIANMRAVCVCGGNGA